jgi:phage regulator Rha-like protein
MQNIVTVINGQPVTTTQIIANNTEVDHASVIKLVRTYQADLEEFGPIRFEIQLANTPQGGGRPTEYADLNEHQSTLILTYMRNSDIVRKFKKALVMEFFELAKRPAFDVPTSLAGALRLAADLSEQKALVEKERDDAVATKALIGSRREATSMATASAATRKVHKLEIELDKSSEYSTVKRMESIHAQKFLWKPLKDLSLKIGAPIQKVADANYVEVNSYRADVWKQIYNVSVDVQPS